MVNRFQVLDELQSDTSESEIMATGHERGLPMPLRR